MGIPDPTLLEQMRRASVRQLVVIWLLYVAVLCAVGLLTSAAGDRPAAAVATILALAIAAWPATRAERLESDLSRWPWLPAVAAVLGALALLLAAPASTTLFPALTTPVGVCLLFAYWRRALAAAAIVTGGYLAASTRTGFDAPLEMVLSEPVALLGVIFVGLGPVRLALATLDARAETVAAWRAGSPRDPTSFAPGRPGKAREHDAEILAGVLAGKSDKLIAFELGMGKASWRVRYRRRCLQSEHGVRDRRALARLLLDAGSLDAP